MALPTPTALSASTRYMVAGTRHWIFVPTIASKAAPTSAELTAGTDLTGELAAQAGFSVTSATLDAPDAGTRFTSKVAGRITSDDSSLTLYESANSTDARTLLTRDLAGFIVICHEGIVTGGKMDVFPVKVTGAPKSGDIEGVATIEFQFVITSVPVENVAVPTA